MQLRDEFMELPLLEEEAPGDESNRPRDDAYASNGMYPLPDMTCMYPPPHMNHKVRQSFMQLRDEFMELPLLAEEAPGDESNRPRDDAYASNGMYPPPHMTCMYPPPQMTR